MENLENNKNENTENLENSQDNEIEFLNNPKKKEAYNKIIKIFNTPLYIFSFLYFTSLFTVFFIPVDILDKSEICANFVNFMSKFYANIEIFGNVSKIPQVIKFHASVVWVFATILCVFALIYTLILEFINSKYDFKTMLDYWSIIGCLFFGYGINIYCSGYIVTHIFDYGIRTIQITMSSKFEIFVYISLFQTAFIGAFFGFIISIIDLILTFFIFKEKLK